MGVVVRLTPGLAGLAEEPGLAGLPEEPGVSRDSALRGVLNDDLGVISSSESGSKLTCDRRLGLPLLALCALPFFILVYK